MEISKMPVSTTLPIKAKLHIAEGEDFPAFAWPGGYPLFYLTNNNDVLCPECANGTEEFDEEIIEVVPNFEDENVYCDHCSRHIESAYGED